MITGDAKALYAELRRVGRIDDAWPRERDGDLGLWRFEDEIRTLAQADGIELRMDWHYDHHYPHWISVRYEVIDDELSETVRKYFEGLREHGTIYVLLTVETKVCAEIERRLNDQAIRFQAGHDGIGVQYVIVPVNG